MSSFTALTSSLTQHGRHDLLKDKHSLLQPFTISTFLTILVDIVISSIIIIMALDFSGLSPNPSVLEAIF